MLTKQMMNQQWQIIGVLVAAVATVIGLSATPVAAQQPEPNGGPSIDFVSNPELMVAGRYLTAGQRATLPTSSYYAANPELMVASRYIRASERANVSTTNYYPANPELMIAHRYEANLAAALTSSLSRNPELMVARRYSRDQVTAQTSNQAANPELMVADRYARAASTASDLATNRGLRAWGRRYSAQATHMTIASVSSSK